MTADEKFLRIIVPKVLRKVADILEKGGQPCEMDDDEVRTSYSALAHGLNNKGMTKEQACSYLNMSRSKFDSLVREGVLPRGKKVQGMSELRWYRADLKRACKKK